MRPLMMDFEDQISEEVIDPGKPFPRKLFGIILVERLMHETGAGMGSLEHFQAGSNFLVFRAR